MARAGLSTEYLTLGRAGFADLEVKRSRFVCELKRVDTEDAAREAIAAIRKERWDAGHHCSALILGPDRAIERSSDDGELTGTAGAPMLEVLRGRELSDVLAVVSRWFGGTKLGTGGLVRAYGDAVREALDTATMMRRTLTEEFVVRVDHAGAGRIENDLRARGVDVLSTEYAEQARIRVGIASGHRGELLSTVAELTSGAVEPEMVGTRWRDAR